MALSCIFLLYFEFISELITILQLQNLLDITAMKKFLIYFCYAAILCSICSCSKDDVQSGVDIEFSAKYFADPNDKYMYVYTMHSPDNSMGTTYIEKHDITYAAKISIDLNPGEYYVIFPKTGKTGFSVLPNRRTVIKFFYGNDTQISYR